MAGYSGTPLPRKLGIKDGSRIALVGAPEGIGKVIGPPPLDIERTAGESCPVDVLVYFTTEAAVLSARFAELAARLAPAGGLWIAWPKKASGVPTDLTDNLVREIGLAAGLVDNKVCAIDDTWSGLRFVYRLADRPGRTASRR